MAYAERLAEAFGGRRTAHGQAKANDPPGDQGWGYVLFLLVCGDPGGFASGVMYAPLAALPHKSVLAHSTSYEADTKWAQIPNSVP